MTNQEIKDEFKEVHKKLDSIIIQTTKTNGRVTGLERFRTIVYWVSGAVLTSSLSLVVLLISK